MTHELSASARFHMEIDRLAEECRPTRHPFFARLAAMSQEQLTSAVLSELHLCYQAAMHATRVMIYLSLVSLLHRRSLGPWCVVEIVSDDWMRGLVDGLAAHFPSIRAEPYFADCFAHAVEECHEREAVEITSLVLDRRPKLLGHTVEDARTLAWALYRLWGTLDEVLDPPGADVAR